MQVKFKKLHDNAVLPTYAKSGDAGADCVATAVESTDLYLEYKLGFSMEVPDGYVGLLFPRSSISKKDLMLANSIGVIDAGYRGEVAVRFKYGVGGDNQYGVGERVCQLIVIPYPKIEHIWADELSDTERGAGGFGSTN